MKFSKNMHALKLYSGILGPFLNDPSQQTNEDVSWLSPEIAIAARWLAENNHYLRPYSQLLSISSSIASRHLGPFPIAQHSSNDPTAPPFRQRDIVLSGADFPPEIHN